jgi:hypothetical protein
MGPSLNKLTKKYLKNVLKISLDCLLKKIISPISLLKYSRIYLFDNGYKKTKYKNAYILCRPMIIIFDLISQLVRPFVFISQRILCPIRRLIPYLGTFDLALSICLYFPFDVTPFRPFVPFDVFSFDWLLYVDVIFSGVTVVVIFYLGRFVSESNDE